MWSHLTLQVTPAEYLCSSGLAPCAPFPGSLARPSARPGGGQSSSTPHIPQRNSSGTGQQVGRGLWAQRMNTTLQPAHDLNLSWLAQVWDHGYYRALFWIVFTYFVIIPTLQQPPPHWCRRGARPTAEIYHNLVGLSQSFDVPTHFSAAPTWLGMDVTCNKVTGHNVDGYQATKANSSLLDSLLFICHLNYCPDLIVNYRSCLRFQETVLTRR